MEQYSITVTQTFIPHVPVAKLFIAPARIRDRYIINAPHVRQGIKIWDFFVSLRPDDDWQLWLPALIGQFGLYCSQKALFTLSQNINRIPTVMHME